MMTRQRIIREVVVGIALFVVFGLFASAGSTFAETTSLADVKKELAEAMDAIRAFSADRKDEALKAMEQALGKMDHQIEQLGDKIKKEWEQMAPEARKKAEETMEQLHRQRDRMAKSIDEWKDNSTITWNKIKDEFMKSYEEFKNSFEDADKQYDKPITYL
jgi:septal ring factor EnvC (AmiA/AmiB activator)